MGYTYTSATTDIYSFMLKGRELATLYLLYLMFLTLYVAFLVFLQNTLGLIQFPKP